MVSMCLKWYKTYFNYDLIHYNVLTLATITKYYTLEGLNDINFLTLLDGKSQD